MDAIEPIAIIGMGCRFPGGPDPESFWKLLAEGRHAVTEVPPDRWDADAWYDPDPSVPGKLSTRWGAFVEGVDCFDASFFGISASEAATLDPQHRLLLEVAWETLEDAGIPAERLAGTRTGVYVGFSNTDYRTLCLQDLSSVNAYCLSGNIGATAAGRVSQFFDIRGPCMAVDTACSSALVAVHMACQGLRLHEMDAALVGGVSLILAPQPTVAMSKAWLMASDGRCRSFDPDADGYVRGEGCGLVLLKRLADAQMAGDRILGVIRGSAVNSDGRGEGLTVPNAEAQADVVRSALRAAALTPDDLDYVEASGVGTPAADLAELAALSAALGDRATARCWVGSVKPNVGHLEVASGMAALLKVLLALRHEMLPAHLGTEHPLPEVLKLRLSHTAVPWPRGRRPRRAGVHSFGLGGTNVHLVLEEGPVDTSVVPAAPPRSELLTLSARAEPALRALAGRYASMLDAHPRPDLADICYSANVGRSRLPCALAAIAESVGELRDGLKAFALGELPRGLRWGTVPVDGLEFQDPTPSTSLLVDTAARYLSGTEVDWQSVYSREARARVSLPTYPFQRKRHWLKSTPPQLASPVPVPAIGATFPAQTALPMELLQAEVGKMLDLPPGQIHPGVLLRNLRLDSLAWLELARRLRADHGITVHLEDIAPGATLEELARDISATAAPCPVLVTLQGGTRSPVFLVTAGYGDVLALRGLAAHLGSDWPVYALQPPRNSSAGAALETLVAVYLQAIRKVQPRGPYRLGGYSSGGLLALAVAQRLRLECEEVPLLALLDPPFRVSTGQLEAYQRLQRLVPSALLEGGSRSARLLRATLADVGLEIHFKALRDYRPLPYPGRITLFLSTPWYLRPLQNGRGRAWRKLGLDGVEVLPLPGAHYDLLREPNVQVLAQHLRERLERSAV